MDIENDLKALDTVQISILFWRQRRLSDKEIGRKFSMGEDWVEARMGEIYKELGFDPKMHARHKKKTLEEDYLPVVKLLTNDDPDTLADWPLKAKKDIDQNRPKSASRTRTPNKTVDQPRSSRRSIMGWLWIPVALLLAAAFYGFYLLGISSIPQSQVTSTISPVSTNSQAGSPQPSSAPFLTATAPLTETSTLTPTPIFTPSATITPLPTNSPSASGLAIGQEISDGRVTLKLIDVRFNERYDRVGNRFAPISHVFEYTNHSGDTLLVQFNTSHFVIEDNTGRTAECWFFRSPYVFEEWNLPLDDNSTEIITTRCGDGQVPQGVTTYTLTIYPFTSLPESTWVVEVPR